MALTKADVEQLVRKHYASLYRFALSLTRNEQEALDLVQEAFARLTAKGSQVRDPSKFKTWLFTTLYREYIREWKRLARHPHLSLDAMAQDPREEVALQPEGERTVDTNTALQALESLDEVYRAPLVLFYLQEHTYQEIADILEVPIGTVMSRISRGRDLLRKLLGQRSQPPQDSH